MSVPRIPNSYELITYEYYLLAEDNYLYYNEPLSRVGDKVIERPLSRVGDKVIGRPLSRVGDKVIGRVFGLEKNRHWK